MTFDITTSNAGPGTAKGVTLNDPLPAGVTWTITDQPAVDPAPCSITVDPDTDKQTLVCDFGDLGAEQSRTVTISASTSFEQCAEYKNTATADAINAPEKTDSDTITCLKPDLTVDKTADKAVVDAGQDVGFTITTTNAGPGAAKSVVLTDKLPAGLTWSIDPAAEGCEIAGDPQVLTCTYDELADDAVRTVHVKATTSFEQCSTYDNTATATSTNHPDATDTDSTRCRQPATVRIDKVVEGEQGSETKFGFTSDLSAERR